MITHKMVVDTIKKCENRINLTTNTSMDDDNYYCKLHCMPCKLILKQDKCELIEELFLHDIRGYDDYDNGTNDIEVQ